jgi:hypothetical protein
VKNVPVGTILPWSIPAKTPSKKKVVHVVAAVKPMIFTPSCKIPLVGQPIGDPFGHDPYHSRLIHVKNGSGRAVSTHREKRSRSLLKKIAAPRQNPHYQRSKFLGQRSNRYLARCPSGPTTNGELMSNLESGSNIYQREKIILQIRTNSFLPIIRGVEPPDLSMSKRNNVVLLSPSSQSRRKGKTIAQGCTMSWVQ